jgi:hypothetical protein
MTSEARAKHEQSTWLLVGGGEIVDKALYKKNKWIIFVKLFVEIKIQKLASYQIH